MKKKIIYSLCIIMIMGLIVSCGKKEDSSGKTESNQEQVLSSEPKHENNYMRALDSTYFKEEIQGKIVDVVNTGQLSYAVTSDNKVYRSVLVDFDYFVTLDSNFKKIASSLMCNNSLVVENKDGTYTAYDFSNPETKYTFKNDNAVCASVDFGVLTVISFENGMLYYSSDGSYQDSITKQRIIVNENKTLGLSQDSDYYTGTYSSVLSFEGFIMATKSNGSLYFIGLTNQSSKDDNHVMSVNWNYGSVESVDKSFITGGLGYYFKPFYTKIADNNNIYVRDKSFSSPTEFMISLPTGYTKDDIENVCAKEEIILVMKDKKTFYKEDASDETWESLDAISELIKNKNIIKIVSTSANIFMLGDDGYLYRFDR